MGLVVGIYRYLQGFSTVPRWLALGFLNHQQYGVLDIYHPDRMLENRGKFKLVLVGNPEHENIDPLVVNFFLICWRTSKIRRHGLRVCLATYKYFNTKDLEA